MKKIPWIVLALVLVMGGCATHSVQRTSSDEVTDLSGRWNDTDSKLVAEKMVRSALEFPWVQNFTEEEGRKPVVIVGDIRNRSTEHIDTRVFTKDIERELIKSGQVKFVAADSERGQIRAERTDQQTESSLDSVKRLGQETGADFIMIGNISSIVDAIQGKKAVFYQVDMELINIETNEKVWVDSKEIKKIIEQSSHKF